MSQKSIYVTKIYICHKKTLEICVSSAVLEFNEGKSGILKVLKKLGLAAGYLQLSAYKSIDLKRKSNMERKSSTPFKKRCKDIRCIRKGWSDTNKEKEGSTYGSGGF